jgi:hypothetical protein
MVKSAKKKHGVIKEKKLYTKEIIRIYISTHARRKAKLKHKQKRIFWKKKYKKRMKGLLKIV